MKEMVGGCCVCSDERGWTENPLVYCDGQGCTVAVHQACYGIVTVPTGPWYCRKCESQERAARVRCELCPSKEGALKRTDNNGWAHVICALYIPEVRFGNVTTMEPILLHHIPTERYSKSCYICEEQSKGSKASIGACMQCNKAGCKQQFHVTCAQAMGLLCEEAGNYMDNVKYCGYCQHHYSKLVRNKKGGNVKTIPAYRPVLADSSSTSDGASEKEMTPKGHVSQAKKKGGKATPKSEGSDKTPAESPTTSTASNSPASSQAPKFTASNFVEVTPAPIGPGKKRKSNARNSPPPSEPPVAPPAAPEEPEKRVKLEPTPPDPGPATAQAKSPKVAASVVVTAPLPAPPPTLIQSLPEPTPPSPVSSPEPGGSGLVFSTTSSHPQHVVEKKEVETPKPELVTPISRQRGRSQSTEKNEKAAKKPRKKSPAPGPGRRGRVPHVSSPPLEQPSTSGQGLSGGGPPPMNSLQQFSTIAASAAPVAVPSPQLSSHSDSSHVPDQGRKHLQHRGPTGSSSESKPAKRDGTREYKLFQNGVGSSAPHMLGNVLNPNSSMAQKMTDTLNAELEAHSVFSATSSAGSSLVGPALPSKMVASARSSINNMLGLNSPNSSATSSFSAALSGAATPGNMPQSLDQLLERQWEQGSQFLMEQAQHFDIASLLTCLHQLRAENVRLEEHVLSLQQRRDHLLAVNARLAIPLPPTQPVTAAMRSTPPQQRSAIPPQMNNFPMENGIPSEASILASFSNRSPVASSSERSYSGQQAPPQVSQMSRNAYYERQSPAGGVASQNMGQPNHPPPSSQAPPQHQQTSPHSNNMGTLRMNPLSIPEQYRREESRRSAAGLPQMQMYPAYQAVSPPVQQSSGHGPSSHVPVVTSHQPMVIRREGMGMEHSNLMLHMHHHQKQS